MDTIMQKPWTPEEIEAVKKMAAEGKTASQIGIEIGRSRNSVIGAVHRNKLQLLARREPATVKPKRERLPKGSHLRRLFMTGSNSKESKHETPPPPPPSKEHYVPFLRRQNHQCKFIVEKRNETYICCGADATRQGWCDYHAAIVFRPPNEQPRYGQQRDDKHKKIHGPSR